MSTVVKANLDLLGKEAKITTMAAFLAREAFFFGEEVMSQCTTQGYGDNLDFQLLNSWRSRTKSAGSTQIT